MELDHVAVFVDDLEQSSLAAALGGWAGPSRSIEGQPALAGTDPATINGRTRRLRVAENAELSLWVEDVVAGTPIRPVPGNAWHHVAVWCDDLAETVRALEQGGYAVELRGVGADGGIAIFAYMVSARGPRLELSEAGRRTRMRAYLGSEVGEAIGDRAMLPKEVATVVESAEDIEALMRCWQKAFGAEWGSMTEEAVRVATDRGERELRMRSVRSLGDPRVAIIAPDAASRALLPPVASSGWHHVGLQSGDLPRDVAAIETLGYRLEFCDRDESGRPRTLAMLAAPEGMRIKLTAA